MAMAIMILLGSHTYFFVGLLVDAEIRRWYLLWPSNINPMAMTTASSNLDSQLRSFLYEQLVFFLGDLVLRRAVLFEFFGSRGVVAAFETITGMQFLAVDFVMGILLLYGYCRCGEGAAKHFRSRLFRKLSLC